MISDLPSAPVSEQRQPERRSQRFQSAPSSSSSQRNGRSDRSDRSDRNNRNNRSDRNDGGGSTGYQFSRQAPERAETVIPYKPPSAEATLRSLQPNIPATALTRDGLANVLFARMAPARRHMARSSTLGEWRSYDRLRGMVSEEAVRGMYAQQTPGADLGGTVAGEVKRMLMRNPTAGRRSKLLVVNGVRKELGKVLGRRKLPQLAAPQIGGVQPAIGAPQKNAE